MPPSELLWTGLGDAISANKEIQIRYSTMRNENVLTFLGNRWLHGAALLGNGSIARRLVLIELNTRRDSSTFLFLLLLNKTELRWFRV